MTRAGVKLGPAAGLLVLGGELCYGLSPTLLATPSTRGTASRQVCSSHHRKDRPGGCNSSISSSSDVLSGYGWDVLAPRSSNIIHLFKL